MQINMLLVWHAQVNKLLPNGKSSLTERRLQYPTRLNKMWPMNGLSEKDKLAERRLRSAIGINNIWPMGEWEYLRFWKSSIQNTVKYDTI